MQKLHSPHATIAKAAEILASMCHNKPWLTQEETAQRLGVHKSTAQRLIRSLCEVGFLEPDYEVEHRYTVGRTLFTLGNLYRESRHYLTAANDVAKVQNRLTGEAVTIIVLDGRHAVTVFRLESVHRFRFDFGVGSIQCAYAPAVGKVLLAELTDEQLEALYPEEDLVPVTSKTVPTKTLLKIELGEARLNGVAVNFEQNCEGLACVASPIRDASGRALAAMGIASPLLRATTDRMEKLSEFVRKGANLISYRLGWESVSEHTRDMEELRSWWLRYGPGAVNSAAQPDATEGAFDWRKTF